MEEQWYSKGVKEILDYFYTDFDGISGEEAKKRLAHFGPNVFAVEKRLGVFAVFLRQFEGPLILVLGISAGVMFAMGDFIDASVVLVVLLINAAVGAVQEGKAEESLAALRRMTESSSVVLRRGRILSIPDRELVPGDILILREGEKVGADARLIEVTELRVDESMLTGESDPVVKTSEVVSADLLAEQRNMVFKGTNILGGEGRAVVVETGENTVVGKLAQKLVSLDTEIPLKGDIRRLSKLILYTMLGVVLVIFFLGIFLGDYSLAEMFRVSVAIAVSAIPEGLPVVVTLVLAAGVWRMSKRNALVKRLAAVEALGQAKVIAVDKTGTVTRNQMMVSSLWVSGAIYEVTGDGYAPQGSLLSRGREVVIQDHPEILLAGKIATLGSNGSFAYSEEEKTWQRLGGDPTETALTVFGEKLGFKRHALNEEYKKIAEIPFDSRIAFHATLFDGPEGSTILAVSGAPERILDRATGVWDGTRPRKIEKKDREEFEKALRKFSREGERMLALAVSFKEEGTLDPEQLPSLCLVALLGISDAIRPEVFDAVRRAKEAGVHIVMITGDHKDTAEAIGAKIGIHLPGNRVLVGKEIEKMSTEELSHELVNASVFARVSPEHKLKIIEGYKLRGETIAMTGDGVNDALSLAAADLGVAMGRIGTAVAKEAGDIVLLDDDFGNIVYAIEEGRNIYRTIKKVVMYLLSTAIGEILVIAVAIVAGYPLPLHASQIIWLNLVTDTFLVIALALEPRSERLLRHFKQPGRSLVDGDMALRIVLTGVAMMAVTLFLFRDYAFTDFAKGTTIALTALAVAQWFNAWNARSATRSVFVMNPFKNIYLVCMLILVILMHIAVVYVPFLQKIFFTVPLTLGEWGAILGISLAVIGVEEVRKFSRYLSHRLYKKETA